MAGIRAEMEKAKADAGFTGDLPAFLHFLRTDPRFYPKTADELLKEAAWEAKTFDGMAGKWFGRLPRRRFAIVPVPPEIAPYYTAGRGGPGQYLVNTYDLPSRHAVPATRADAARERARPRVPDSAGRGEHRVAAVPPPELHQRLWRGLGAVLRATG